MLYVLLTATLPFVPTSAEARAVMDAIKANPLEDLFARHAICADPGIQSALRNLLEVEPARRMTAKELLDHPWISTDDLDRTIAPGSLGGGGTVLEMMKAFAAESIAPQSPEITLTEVRTHGLLPKRMESPSKLHPVSVRHGCFLFVFLSWREAVLRRCSLSLPQTASIATAAGAVPPPCGSWLTGSCIVLTSKPNAGALMQVRRAPSGKGIRRERKNGSSHQFGQFGSTKSRGHAGGALAKPRTPACRAPSALGPGKDPKSPKSPRLLVSIGGRRTSTSADLSAPLSPVNRRKHNPKSGQPHQNKPPRSPRTPGYMAGTSRAARKEQPKGKAVMQVRLPPLEKGKRK